MTQPHDSAPGDRVFPVTQWSVVLQVGHADPLVRQRALEGLLRQYWTPMRAHLIRVKRVRMQDADDLLQGFVADKVLALELFEKARQGKGRLRSLLLTALDRYVIDNARAGAAQKRRGGQAESLEDSARLAAQPAEGADTFDILWAREVLDRAVTLMKQECDRMQHPEFYEVFDGRVLGPLLTGQEAMPYKQLIDAAKFASPSRASEALKSATALFVRCTRDVVGEYVASPAEIDEELADLRRVLGSSLK